MQNYTQQVEDGQKVGEEELRRRARCEALADPASEYFRTSLRVISSFMRSSRLEKKKMMSKGKVYCDVALESGELNFLQDKFGYEIDAKATGASYHSNFAEVFGRCMQKRLLDTKNWVGEDVVCLEGDLRVVIARAAKWMHVCRYGLNAQARARHIEEDNFVYRTMYSRNERMKYEARDVNEQMKMGGGVNVCLNGQQCHFEADTVVVQPQFLQMGARQVADATIQHGAKRAKGWFFFVPSMLSGGSGIFLKGKFRYVVDVEEGLVTVFPVGCEVAYCTYNVMNMLSFIRNRTFVWKGETFIVELHGDDEGVMNWVMTRTSEVYDFENEDSDIPIWSDADADSVVMSFLTHVPGQEDEGAKRVILRTSGTLVQKVVSRLLSREESGITMTAARSALKDFSDQYVELGGFIRLPKGLDGIVFEYVARGCYRRARYAKVSMMIEDAVAKGAYEMVNAGLTGSYVEGIMNLVRETGRSVVNILKMPVTDVLEAARTESWDASVVPEEPAALMRMLWDPDTRGVSVLGLDTSLISRSSRVSGKKVIKQAWDWFKTRSENAGDSIEGESIRESVTTVERKPLREELGADRSKLVQSLVLAYDASDRPKVDEFVDELTHVRPTVLTPALVMDDPYTAMQEDFDTNFPGVAMCDYGVRPYLAAVSDREYSNQLVGMKAKASEEAPRSTFVKQTVLRSGLSGPRPMIMAEVGAAFGKRVGGAPNYQFPQVEAEAAAKAVDRFIRVCFRDGWQEEVRRRVSQGLWQPRSASVNTVVSKMTPSVVAKASSESFTYSDIIMTEYEAMFKRQPKDKLESSTAFEHTPCQTIMYQKSKSTNALFSSLLGEVHDLIDAILRPGFLINMRRDKDYAEKVWNATRNRRKKFAKQMIDVDISQCDKSQTRYNLGLYMELMRRLGMPDEVAQYWEIVLGRKRATASQTSFVVEFLAQVLSGLFATISMNSLIVGIATMDSAEVEPDQLLNVLVSGDDVVLALSQRKNLQLMADRYASMYNFEVKVFEPDVLYWCGRYFVEIGGYEFFVKDPEKAFSSLARDQPASYAGDEAFESFVDDTKAYAWEEIIIGTAKAVQRRHNRNVAPVGICRGIASVRRSKDLFLSRFVEGLKEYYM